MVEPGRRLGHHLNAAAWPRDPGSKATKLGNSAASASLKLLGYREHAAMAEVRRTACRAMQRCGERRGRALTTSSLPLSCCSPSRRSVARWAPGGRSGDALHRPQGLVCARLMVLGTLHGRKH